MKTGYSTSLYILASLLLLVVGQSNGQNQEVWEQRLNSDFNTNIPYNGRGFFVHQNGNKYVVMASTIEPSTGNNSETHIIHLDTSGQILQEQSFVAAGHPNTSLHQTIRTDAVYTHDGNYAFVELVGSTDDTIALKKIDTNGNLLWEVTYPTNTDTSYNSIFYTARLQQLNNGDYLILKEFAHPVIANWYKIVFQRVSSTGTPIWEQIVHQGNKPRSNVGSQATIANPDYVFEQSNGELWHIKRLRGYVQRYDNLGNVISSIIPMDTATSGITIAAGIYGVQPTHAGGLLALSDEYLVEMDTALAIQRIMRIGYWGNSAIEAPNGRSAVQPTADGGCVLLINQWNPYPTGDKIWLVKLDAAWNIEWNREFTPNTWYPSARLYDVKLTSDGGYILTGFNNTSVWVVKTDSLGRYKTNVIQGNVYADYNSSCSLDTTDVDLQDVILTFQSTTTQEEYYTKTNP